MIKSQKGFTIAMVIFLIAVIVIIIATVFTYNASSRTNSVKIGNIQKVLQVAEAGINTYLYHLKKDPYFYKDPVGIHIKGDNPSEELGLVPIINEYEDPELYKVTTLKDDNNNIVGFYQIKIVQPADNKYLEVISTGWTNEDDEVRKTISVKLKNNTFCDYMLFTNGKNTFYPGSTFKGPVFSNEDINIVSTTNNDPVFEENLFSAKSVNITGKPKIIGDVLNNQPRMRFPSLVYNKQKIAEIADFTYKGRTCILLRNDFIEIRNINNGDELRGQKLVSPFTVYVEDGPVFISGKLDGKLTVYCTGDIYITGKDPTYIERFNKNYYYEPHAAQKTGGISYAGSQGNAFDDDFLGLISEKNIRITTRTWPHTKYGTEKWDYPVVSTEDMIICGVLIAAENIEVEDYYPYSFELNTLNLFGSQICDKIILQGNGWSSGYKNITFTYDYRLKTDYPPHIISPEDSEWIIKAWEEVLNMD